MFYKQQVIPAISNHQALKRFLASSYEFGILMNFQLAQLPSLVETLHQHNKKILVHSELIKGLAHDEFGAIYLIQELHVDGIISSKPKVIEVCKKRHVIAIFRFFLKDSISLEQSIEITRKIEPPYLEVLPAISTSLISVLKKELNVDIMMGGLLTTKSQVEKCIDAGAIAVTASNPDLW